MLGARGALHEQPADDVSYAPGGMLGEPFNRQSWSLIVSGIFARGTEILNWSVMDPRKTNKKNHLDG
jgi:hypothetical protein